jgi:hypothetical protein
MRKIYCLVALLFWWFGSTAQNSYDRPVGKTKQRVVDTLNHNHDPLIVLNDNVYKDDVNKVNPNDLLEITVFKDSIHKAAYGELGSNGVIKLTTIPYAKTTYQTHLSGFSIKYKNYLASHQYDDSRIVYILDGKKLQGKVNDIIGTLYHLPAEKIMQVSFNEKELNTKGQAIVIVTTTTKFEDLK